MLRPTPTSRPPCAAIMRKIGLDPDPWQVEVLESTRSQLLLNCCRQAGKSTVVAMLGLLEAMWNPMTHVVLISRSHRQSREMLRLMVLYYRLLGERVKANISANEIEFEDALSRIVCLPCREDTIRGYSHVDLLIIDEAARVPDDLYRAVRPMLAVSKGRLICLSTPFGKRGFFWDAWVRGGDNWQRFEVSADQVPRITPEFLEQERQAIGESSYRQEYFCSFEAQEGLVYPDFHKCVVKAANPADFISRLGGRPVGGIDFGFRNPFAALWGVVDRDDVLWLTGEHYARHLPLSENAARLPRQVTWYADPSGANEIAEMRWANFTILKGNNSLRTGIGAVNARLRAGTLKVVEGCCPNLLIEAGLYCYGKSPGERGAELPVDENNHALAALRYLISKLDARRMVQRPQAAPPVEEKPREIDWDDDRYWMPLDLTAFRRR